jgi:hypothetical protein
VGIGRCSDRSNADRCLVSMHRRDFLLNLSAGTERFSGGRGVRITIGQVPHWGSVAIHLSAPESALFSRASGANSRLRVGALLMARAVYEVHPARRCYPTTESRLWRYVTTHRHLTLVEPYVDAFIPFKSRLKKDCYGLSAPLRRRKWNREASPEAPVHELSNK